MGMFDSLRNCSPIRAKETEIDAFSNGELDFNRFGERARILPHWKQIR
ncbi:MAG: hypothetical protein ACYSYV_12230 [Planctomycetota bacterium]|jgi:hypothetical protein